MKKLFFIIIIALPFAIISCTKNPTIINKEGHLRIGYLGPMTGERGNTGKVLTQSIKIAVDEFNASGGVHGIHAELIIEDTMIDVKKGIRAMNRLADDYMALGVVGAWSSTVSLAVAPIAEEKKIIMISPASSHKDLPDKGKFIFRTIPSDNLQTVVFARYLARVEKIKSLGILHLNNDYSRTNAMDFKTEYEKNGGRIIVLENGNQGDKDFIQQLKRIKAAKPEAIYLPTFTVETAVILEQIKQIGLKVKIFSSSTFANPIIFDLAGDAADGVVFVQASEQPSGKNRKIFESNYYEKWGKKPEAASLDDVTRFYDGTYNWGMKPDSYSLRAYDAANIILNAIRVAAIKDEAGNVHIDRDKICSIVAATRDYNGVSGKITFTPNGDLSSDTGIFTAKNRKYLQMKVYRLNGDNLMRVK